MAAPTIAASRSALLGAFAAGQFGRFRRSLASCCAK
jgi:hypothetical protein